MQKELLTQQDRKDIKDVLERMEDFFYEYFTQPFNDSANLLHVSINQSLVDHNITGKTFNNIEDMFIFLKDNVIKWPAEKVKDAIKGLVKGTLYLWKATKNICGEVGQAIMGGIRSCFEKISNILRGRNKVQNQEQVMFEGLKQLPAPRVTAPNVSAKLIGSNSVIVDSTSKEGVATLNTHDLKESARRMIQPLRPEENAINSRKDTSVDSTSKEEVATLNTHAAKERARRRIQPLSSEEQAVFNAINSRKDTSKDRKDKAVGGYKKRQHRKVPGLSRRGGDKSR